MALQKRVYVFIALVVIAILAVWNYTGPVLRTTGTFISGRIAALNGEAPPAPANGGEYVAPAPLTIPAPVGPEVADGPVEEEELGRSVWNGATFDWDNVPAEIADNQYLVAHGDLRAKGESAIAVFKTAKDAKAYLKHGTWAMVLVTVPDGETVNEYLEALNERLGSGYSLVLKP